MFERYSHLGCFAACLIILATCAFVFGILCLEAWLVMLLWNAVMPALWAGAPVLTFWLSMGIICLITVLFKLFTLKVDIN